MKHLGLFEGIGGFSLAARWAGWETVAWCEWNEFGQKVLKHHFPEAQGHGDITKTDFTIYANRIDVITGGFPCQPYSTAGKRLGKADERHLWPEMLRAIREVQPRYVVGENVRGLTNWNRGMVFDEVQADLEAQGYEVLPFLLPACAVNAPHRRDRIWFVAHSNNSYDRRESGKNEIKGGEEQLQQRNEIWKPIESSEVRQSTSNPNSIGQTSGFKQQEPIQQGQFGGSDTKTNASNPASKRLEGLRRQAWGCTELYSRSNENRGWETFPTQSPICSGDDGLPTELDGITLPKWRNESIKAYGNAIVPQVAYEIFKVINKMEQSPAKQKHPKSETPNIIPPTPHNKQ